MNNLEKIIRKGQVIIWGVMTIVCLGSAIFFGAWHHIVTAAFSYAMYSINRGGKEKR